jgi:RimJ/RimL family protein N-acetyltransferase
MLSHLSRLHLADLALAYVDTRNAASIAVLARLGFSRVRTIEGADYFKNAVSDEYEYVRTMSLPPAG